MKCILFAAAFALFAMPAAADGWAMITGYSMPEKEPEASYRLDVAGYDTRVYEWTPTNSPNTICIAQFSSSGPVGMQCVPKEADRE